MRHPFLQGLRPAFLCLCLFFPAATLLYGQVAELNYNVYYRFPLSVGFEYQSLSPFKTYGADFNVFDLSASLRRPFRSLPMLQPALKLGMMHFEDQNLTDARDWTHTHWYGAMGMAYANRFAKNFELGGEALVGFSEAVFAELLPEVGTVNTPYLQFDVGARIALNPSYNFSIDVHPSLKYLYSLGVLKDFDGFLFGIGFAASYRFGQDPDAPQAIIRSIRFEAIAFPAVFAAMQSYYTKNPIGRVRITNTEKSPITDLEVSFFQAGYMDSPTPAASIPELKGGESLEVELKASFNQQVFTTEGVTPLTGEVIARYKKGGRAAEQSQTVTYDLNDKTSITWDDDRKVAAFITPSDSALRNYTSFIRQACKEETISGYSGHVQLAVQVFNALGEIGCLYQSDPVMPFTKVQENPMVIDSVSLPRDTLKRITGDCDDLTVLFCSLLESAGTETAFITVPGHIYSAFNTKVPAADFRAVHPDRSLAINLDGELWVPVEITMIGKAGFLEAWRRGIDEWAVLEGRPGERGFYTTRACQEIYRSVGLKETDLGLQYGRQDAIREQFRREMDRLIGAIVEETAAAAKKSGRKEDYNTLGILYGRFRRLAQAEEAFNAALRIDPGYLNAQINLVSLLFAKKAYPECVNRYKELIADLERRKQERSDKAFIVLLNLSRACYEMGRYVEAVDYHARAAAIDPRSAGKYAYLAKPGGEGSGEGYGESAREGGRERAGAAPVPADEVLFAEE